MHIARLVLFITSPYMNSIRLTDLGYHGLKYSLQCMLITCTQIRNVVPMPSLLNSIPKRYVIWHARVYMALELGPPPYVVDLQTRP